MGILRLAHGNADQLFTFLPHPTCVKQGQAGSKLLQGAGISAARPVWPARCSSGWLRKPPIWPFVASGPAFQVLGTMQLVAVDAVLSIFSQWPSEAARRFGKAHALTCLGQEAGSHLSILAVAVSPAFLMLAISSS